MNSTVGVTYV